MPPTAIGIGVGLSRVSPPPPLILDFRSPTWGFGTDPPAGCGYARAACASTVQTGASTLFDLSALSAVANVIVSGRASDSWEIGIAIEEPRTNLITYGRNYAQASWTVFGSATRTAGQSDPFGGTGASRIQAPSGTHGLGETIRTSCAGVSTASAWLRSHSGTAAPNLNTDRSSARIATNATATTAWGRLSFTATGGGAETTALVPVDGRDHSAIGGVVNGARDFAVDACQREVGGYPTSFIPTAGAITTRNAGFLPVLGATWASRILGGRAGILRHFRPMGARSEYSGTRYLWWLDANNHVSFAAATGVVTVTIAGVTNTTSALAWSRYADAQVFVEMGAGVSYVALLADGVRTVPSVAGSALGSLSAGDLYLGSSNVGGHTCAWNYKAGFFAPGTRPDWAW